MWTHLKMIHLKLGKPNLSYDTLCDILKNMKSFETMIIQMIILYIFNIDEDFCFYKFVYFMFNYL